MARTRGHGVWLVAILMLATALRLIRLGTFPYWQDEVHNLLKAEHILDVLTKGTLVSNHPPLFALLVAGWRAIGMDVSEWTMRMLPALIGVLVVAATYVAGARMVNRRTGLMSAYLVAVSPIFLVHSQDLKVYILLPLTATVLALTLFEAAARNTARWWAAYAMAAGIACYSDVFALPLLVGLNMWFLIQLRGRANRLPGWIIGNIAGAALFLPYLGILLRRANIALIQPATWWLPPPTLVHVAFYFKSVAFGYSDAEPFFKIALALFLLAAAVGTVVAFARDWRPAALLLCWLTIPIAVVFVASQFTNSFFLIRGLLPFAIPFYVLVGAGLARIELKPVRSVITALFGAMAVLPAWQHYTRDLPIHEMPHRPGIHFPFDSDGAALYIADNFRDGDVVIHTSPATWLPFYWYGLRDRPQFQAAVGVEHIAVVNTMGPSTTGASLYAGYFPQDVSTASADARRVWLVFADWEREYLPGNSMQVWRWLNANYREREATRFEGLELRLYEYADPSGDAILRDNDDGISAEFRWNNADEPYRITVPDSGIVESPELTRRGALRLSFDAEPAAEMHTIARTPDRRAVSFALTNTSNVDAHMLVNAVANDVLLSAGTFTRENQESSVWRTGPQHNPTGDPRDYELIGAAAHFTGAETAAITRTVSIPTGAYDTRCYMIATPENTEHLRASIGVFVQDADILARAPRNRPGQIGWRWVRGTATTIGNDPTTVRIVADHLLGRARSYADVAYIGFIRQRGAPRAGQAEPFDEPWPGEITLAPGERRSWALQIDADTARIDVWAYEHGADGRAYYIHEARPAVESSAAN